MPQKSQLRWEQFSQYAYPHCKERYVECANFLGIAGKNDDEKFENFLKAIEELKDKGWN